MSKPFKVTIENHIAEMVFNKPPVNAFNCQGWADIAAEIEALGNNNDVYVIVIRADSTIRGFCAGVDIKELQKDGSIITKVNKGNYDTFKAIHRNPKPVIVAVHGFVLGGGIGICGAADVIVAAEGATFAVPEVDRGAMGGGAHLQRMFPVQKVRYMYFTGEAIDAQEAYRLGAVEKVVPLEQLRNEAMNIAEKIAKKSPAMIALAKEALTGIEDGNLEDKYRWEQGFTLQAYNDKDSQEARDAFVQKRDASFDKK